MRKNLWPALLLRIGVLLGIGTILTLTAGCAAVSSGGAREPVIYDASDYDCSFEIPDEWVVGEEKKRQDSLTVRLDYQADKHAFITVTLYTAGLHTAESAAAEAEEMLRRGLFGIEEPILRCTFILASGESVTLLEAGAGDKEKIEARSGLFFGSNYNAVVTMVSRHDHYADCIADFESILTTFILE